MITGIVTADREATIQILVRGPSGREERIEAVVDTGFDGWLSLTPALIARLALEWRRRGRAVLADGSECVFDIYDGIAVWDGTTRRVTVDEADPAPLVGMGLLYGYELNVKVHDSGSVTITALPSIGHP